MHRLFFPSLKNQHRPYLLRSKALALYCAVLVIFQIGFNLYWNTKKGEVIAATSITAAQLFQLTNNERTKLGLVKLEFNQKLATAAYNKGVDMFADQYWAHVAPDGTTPWTFILNAGYDYHYAGENLAKDFTNATSVVKAWMNSPSHRDNIVNPEFEELGVAVVTGIFDGQETTVCVQMFGALMPQTETQVTPNNNNPQANNIPSNNEVAINNTPPTNTEIAQDTTTPNPPLIIEPKNNSLLNDDKPIIAGIAFEQATVTIYDAAEEMGSLPTDTQNAFSLRPEKSLKEGEHLLSATATDQGGNKSEPSATTTVIIDTFPPFIDVDSIILQSFYRLTQKAIRVEVIVLADPIKVTAAIGEYALVLKAEEGNRYTGILVPPEELLKQYPKVKIQTYDQAGNRTQTEKEIPSFPEKATTQNTGAILGVIQSNTTGLINQVIPENHQETNRLFYSIFGIGLMGLMTLNAAIIEKRKTPIEGTHTLTHAVILGISLMGVVWGNLGVITSGMSIIR